MPLYRGTRHVRKDPQKKGAIRKYKERRSINMNTKRFLNFRPEWHLLSLKSQYQLTRFPLRRHYFIRTWGEWRKVKYPMTFSAAEKKKKGPTIRWNSLVYTPQKTKGMTTSERKSAYIHISTSTSKYIFFFGCEYIPWVCSWYCLDASDTGWYTTGR